MHWGCYYATALDNEVDPQRCCLGSRQSDFALQAVVECRALAVRASPCASPHRCTAERERVRERERESARARARERERERESQREGESRRERARAQERERESDRTL